MLKKLIYIIPVLLFCLSASAQEQQEDSLVVLMSSKSAQLVDIEGASYRKVVGPARFLHNNTYLLCDTALWNVDSRFIDAWGNVSILQDETVLTSDKLTYLIDEDLAQFRGSLVQLQDKDHNVLRTRFLDYNTQDSVAVFDQGGAMRDKDGQIIESREGTYDSKIKKFTFDGNVNMFTDSIFIKTANLVYESERNLATFGRDTNAWKEDNMLSAGSGWYDRGIEQFFFTDRVHVMSEDQEAWCDSLYFNRNTNLVEMLGNVQVSDTTRNVFALAGRIEYLDSISRVTLTREPAVISQTEEQDGSVDTVYLGADKLVYYTLEKHAVDSASLAQSAERLKALEIDPVGEFRKKAAAAAAKAAEEEAKNDPNQRAKQAAQGIRQSQGTQPAQGAASKPAAAPAKSLPKMQPKAAKLPKAGAAPPDTSAVADIPVPSDSLALSDTLVLSDSLALKDSLMVSDSLMVGDSLAMADAAPLDTTKIGFLEALKNVRIYKKNMQVVCDSLVYSDLDSLARLFIQPVVWQEEVRQYAADSITVVVRNNAMDKASLMSNAFITIQQDTLHYNQIRGAEMTAYFDDKGGLDRFDALGGASALFYIEENDALATVNKTDSKMLSAVFKDGNIERIHYYESPKNDGYPVVQLKEEEKQMKGFSWQPERRPADREAVTKLSLRPSERSRYSRVQQPRYVYTDVYFPGYIDDVKRQIEVRDSLRQVRERERALAEQQAKEQATLDSLELAKPALDSLAAAKDSLSVAKDSLGTVSDSLSVADSSATADSSLAESVDSVVVKDKKELRDERKAEREAAKLRKKEKKEQRWADLDKRDEEKARIKEEKKKEKERKRKRRALEGMARQAEKDAQTLQRYQEKYEKEKLKQAEKAARKKWVTNKS